MYPETKGRSLEEIDDIFVQSKGPFDAPRIAKQFAGLSDALNRTKDDWNGKAEIEHVEQ
jgi:hypothetical protein